jgi:integrase
LALGPRHHTLTEITVDLIDEFVAAREKAGASNGEINGELAILKCAFTLAAQAHKVHARPHIEMLRRRRPRSGFFEHAEFRRLCKHLLADLEALARICYVNGWRWKSEVRPLAWNQIGLRRGTITIEPGKAKGREPRIFVMTPHLKKLLKARWKATAAVKERTRKIARSCSTVRASRSSGTFCALV